MKKKKHKSVFGEFYSPYMTNEKTNMDSWYEDYKNDPDKLITINGLQYSKIIFRCQFYREEDYSLNVLIDPPETLEPKDILVDENGNEFVIKGFEMIRFSTIPEWYPRITPMLITGQTYDIGNYLAKKTRQLLGNGVMHYEI